MIATTRGALLRGSTTDEYGDEVETDTPLPGFGDFPLSIIERQKSVQDPTSGAWQTIRVLTARVPATVPVNEGDRIRDHADGVIYALDQFTRTRRGISGRSSVSLTLKRISP